MFWNIAAAAIAAATGFFAWQYGGASLAIQAAAFALFASLSITSYFKWKPFRGVTFGALALALVTFHFTGGGVGYALLTFIVAFLLQAGIHDLTQEKHSLERVFPLLAHCRRFAELIRPEIQQYWIERDTEGKPASRDDRSWCYAAAKDEPTDISFGTKRDYHKPGQIHIRNNTFPIPDRVPIHLKPLVIGPNCRIPAVLHGRFGVGDMSFGSLGQNAIEALASGAARAGILLSTGEGGLTPYHLNGVKIQPTWPQYVAWAIAYGLSFFSKNWRRESMPRAGYIGCGQIMLEIGTGKFGVRTANGEFDYDKYEQIMRNPRVVATKLKLAQGAKPGGGGILPGAKVSEEIARIRGIRPGVDCISPNTWSECDLSPDEVDNIVREITAQQVQDEDIEEKIEKAKLELQIRKLAAFIKRLRERSGKPVGIKIVAEERFVKALCEYMEANPGEGPDFIHVDGGEGGTGAAPLMLADFVGMSILTAIPLVDNLLREHRLRDRVILMSSGKVFNPAQLLIQLALGADYVLGARGFMFALGCIQAMKCSTGECPAGVTTHHWWLQRALVPRVKYIRVANYAEAMHKHLIKLLRVVGVMDTYQLNRSHLLVVSSTHKEISGSLVHAYPAGVQRHRVAPTPETYGLTAPAGPPKPRPSPGVTSASDPLPPHVDYAPEPVAQEGEPQLVQLGFRTKENR